MIRFNSQHCFSLANNPLFHHIDSDAHGCEAGSLSRSGLQHPELAIFDCKLNVLHILVMLLKTSANRLQLAVGLGHYRLEFSDGPRGSDPGDYILALSIDEEFTVEFLVASRRVASKGYTRGTVITKVTKNHGLYRYRRAPMIWNLVELAVGYGAIVIPRTENCANRAPKLIMWIVGKFFSHLRSHF